MRICSDKWGLKEMKMIFECEAERINTTLNDEQLTKLYLEAVEKDKKRGYTPVLISIDDTLKYNIENNYNEYGGAKGHVKTLISMDSYNGKSIFDEIISQIEDYLSDETDGVMFDDGFSSMEMEGQKIFNVSACTQFMDEYENYLLHVPTDKPYEIFAWIPFGGWNECPPAKMMIPMFRYWYENYGVLPAYISNDSLLVYLYNPITDKEKINIIAKEYLALCPDLVGMGGTPVVKMKITDSNVWDFWWD